MVLLLGVGIASVTDLQLNLLGSIIAVLTIAATCVGQIVSLCLPFPHELVQQLKLAARSYRLSRTLHIHILACHP
jgi:hypothetical protein